MKSLKFVLLGLFAMVCFNANAQVFVSGSVGFSSSGGSVKMGDTQTDKTSTTAFNFSPAAGYFLTEEFAVGLGLSFSTRSEKTPGATEIIDTETGIGFTPFVRYYPLIIDRFSVFGVGGVSVSTATSKTKSGGTTVDNPSTSGFTVFAMPGVAFDLNDNISLETTINVLALSFHSETQKLNDNKDTDTSFNFGAGLDNIINTGNISIGAIYRF